MKTVSSFSDKFLIQAASDYVYEMSNFHIHSNPIAIVKRAIRNDYHNRYEIVMYKCEKFKRSKEDINLRYLLILDKNSFEYALIFQGSSGDVTSVFKGDDSDWSNNLNIAAKLELDNYDLAKKEFEYLKYSKKYNITAVSGNSLGGGYALYIGDFYEDVKAIGLNSAPREKDGRFKNNKNSINLILSSDALSRSLILDKSRYITDNRNKLNEVYGIKPYRIKRSVPLNNENNIIASHVGGVIDYRSILLKLFNNNFAYYNAKIITDSSDKANFALSLIKRTYKELNQIELIRFTDHNIYPILTKEDKAIVDTYKNYPKITDFIGFDNNNLNLIIDSNTYNISDKQDFMFNVNENYQSFKKSSYFFLENSVCELKSVLSNHNVLYNNPKFLSEKMKFSVPFDFNLTKEMLFLPLSLKMQIKDILELNIPLFLNVNSKLNKAYKIKDIVSNEEELSYIKALFLLIKQAKKVYCIINSNIETMMDNLQTMIIETPKKFNSNLYDQTIIANVNTHIPDIELDLIKKQDYLALNAYGLIRGDIEDGINDINHLINSFINCTINHLENDLQSKENNKLHKQLIGLQKNIDFSDFFKRFINEYEKDLVSYLIKDGVSITIKYNLIQLLELNESYLISLNNLDKYVKNFVNKSQYKIFKNDFEIITKSLSNIECLIKKVI